MRPKSKLFSVGYEHGRKAHNRQELILVPCDAGVIYGFRFARQLGQPTQAMPLRIRPKSKCTNQ